MPDPVLLIFCVLAIFALSMIAIMTRAGILFIIAGCFAVYMGVLIDDSVLLRGACFFLFAVLCWIGAFNAGNETS